MQTLADHTAFSDAGQVRTSIARLSQENLREEETEIRGELQGVLPKARIFEFQEAESAAIVRGKIAPTISDPSTLNEKLHEPVIAKFVVTRVGLGRPRYLLVEVEAAGAEDRT